MSHEQTAHPAGRCRRPRTLVHRRDRAGRPFRSRRSDRYRGQVAGADFGYSVLGTDADVADGYSRFRPCSGDGRSNQDPGSADPPVHHCSNGTGFSLPVIVSPRAYVSRHRCWRRAPSSCTARSSTRAAVVGRNCILNSHSLVEHDSMIEDHCHIATAAAINSGVHVGAGTFIGSNAVFARASASESAASSAWDSACSSIVMPGRGFRLEKERHEHADHRRSRREP